MPSITNDRYFRRPSGDIVRVFESTRIKGGQMEPPTYVSEKGETVICDSEGDFWIGDEKLVEVKA